MRRSITLQQFSNTPTVSVMVGKNGQNLASTMPHDASGQPPHQPQTTYSLGDDDHDAVPSHPPTAAPPSQAVPAKPRQDELFEME